MNADLEKLLSLKDVDREIARLQAEIAELPRRVAAIETKLAGIKAHIEEVKARGKANESKRRSLEAEIQSQQQKISKYRDQSLEVKTNDQYKALMHEISFAEKDIRNCEDQILEIMLETESQDKDLKQAELEQKSQAAEVEKEKSLARARTEQDERELGEWSAKRATLRAGINSDVLERYDRVVRARGVAIAEVRDQKCMACNVVLRPQTYDELRSNQLIMSCDSCGRILYYDATRDAVPAEAQPA